MKGKNTMHIFSSYFTNNIKPQTFFDEDGFYILNYSNIEMSKNCLDKVKQKIQTAVENHIYDKSDISVIELLEKLNNKNSEGFSFKVKTTPQNDFVPINVILNMEIVYTDDSYFCDGLSVPINF